MRLKFEARKAEVDRHRKQCTQWNKLEQEKTQKTMQSILRKNEEKSSKNDKREDNGF